MLSRDVRLFEVASVEAVAAAVLATRCASFPRPSTTRWPPGAYFASSRTTAATSRILGSELVQMLDRRGTVRSAAAGEKPTRDPERGLGSAGSSNSCVEPWRGASSGQHEGSRAWACEATVEALALLLHARMASLPDLASFLLLGILLNVHVYSVPPFLSCALFRIHSRCALVSNHAGQKS